MSPAGDRSLIKPRKILNSHATADKHQIVASDIDCASVVWCDGCMSVPSAKVGIKDSVHRRRICTTPPACMSVFCHVRFL